jgi:hypothetical protein
MRTIAIDPGATAGVAVAENARIVHAQAMQLVVSYGAQIYWDIHRPVLKAVGRGPLISRGNHLITLAVGVGRSMQKTYKLLPTMTCDRVIGEKPLLTTYRPVNSSPDPVVRGNDMIQTAIRLGVYLEACKAPVCTLVYPGQWKGQVPKDIHLKRTLAKLTPAERANVENDHNAIDATGLLLWGIGR